MIIAKQMDVRANIKKYFDLAYEGEPVVVPRKENKNVMIISEAMYNEMMSQNRIKAYAQKLGAFMEQRSEVKSAVPDDIKSLNLKKLEKIAALRDGWNGNGAPALPRELIERVRKLLNELLIQPEIFPTALMTIQFEYDNTRRDHMEIEIGLNDEAEIFIVRYDGGESFEKIAVDADAINDRVRIFYV